MIRVAAYCRVSTDKEDQANSFEAQQRYFRECIERNPSWELHKIYADEGISGTGTQKRTQFNAMIRASKEGEIDLIVTKEVSRFARNTLDTLEYTRMLRRLGIGVLFLIDNINTLDADGELRLTIMASLAQEESRKTSSRVKWGQTQSMKKGVVFGGSLLGYDVVNGELYINPTGAKTVRAIFHKYLNEGKGVFVIAKELREEGVISSRGNVNWSASTVLKILKNEKYCGDLIQKKTYTPDYLTHEKRYNKGQEELVVLRDHHEPILDRTIWDAAQKEMERRCRGSDRKHGHGSCLPLSGKIECACCGSCFLSRTKKNRQGESYRVWRCGKATAEGVLRGCNVGRQLRDDTAMDIVKRTLKAAQTDFETACENLTHIVEEVLEEGKAGIRRLERDLEGEKEKKRRALEAFIDNTISRDDLCFVRDRCDERMSKILQEISEMESRGGWDIRAAIAGALDSEDFTAICCSHLLHRIIVSGDGRVEVALKFLSARWFYTL